MATHYHQSVGIRLPLWSLMNRKIGLLAKGSLQLRRLIETTKNLIQGKRAGPPHLPNICLGRKKKSLWRSCVQGWKTQSSELRGSSTKMKCLLPAKTPPQAAAQMHQAVTEQTLSNLHQTGQATHCLVPLRRPCLQVIRYRRGFSRTWLIATKMPRPNTWSRRRNLRTSEPRRAAPSLWKRLQMLLPVVYQTEEKGSRL